MLFRELVLNKDVKRFVVEGHVPELSRKHRAEVCTAHAHGLCEEIMVVRLGAVAMCFDAAKNRMIGGVGLCVREPGRAHHRMSDHRGPPLVGRKADQVQRTHPPNPGHSRWSNASTDLGPRPGRYKGRDSQPP